MGVWLAAPPPSRRRPLGVWEQSPQPPEAEDLGASSAGRLLQFFSSKNAFLCIGYFGQNSYLKQLNRQLNPFEKQFKRTKLDK